MKEYLKLSNNDSMSTTNTSFRHPPLPSDPEQDVVTNAKLVVISKEALKMKENKARKEREQDRNKRAVAPTRAAEKRKREEEPRTVKDISKFKLTNYQQRSKVNQPVPVPQRPLPVKRGSGQHHD